MFVALAGSQFKTKILQQIETETFDVIERFRTSYGRREYEKRNCIVWGTEKQKDRLMETLFGAIFRKNSRYRKNKNINYLKLIGVF